MIKVGQPFWWPWLGCSCSCWFQLPGRLAPADVNVRRGQTLRWLRWLMQMFEERVICRTAALAGLISNAVEHITVTWSIPNHGWGLVVVIAAWPWHVEISLLAFQKESSTLKAGRLGYQMHALDMRWRYVDKSWVECIFNISCTLTKSSQGPQKNTYHIIGVVLIIKLWIEVLQSGGTFNRFAHSNIFFQRARSMLDPPLCNKGIVKRRT